MNDVVPTSNFKLNCIVHLKDSKTNLLLVMTSFCRPGSIGRDLPGFHTKLDRGKYSYFHHCIDEHYCC